MFSYLIPTCRSVLCQIYSNITLLIAKQGLFDPSTRISWKIVRCQIRNCPLMPYCFPHCIPILVSKTNAYLWNRTEMYLELNEYKFKFNQTHNYRPSDIFVKEKRKCSAVCWKSQLLNPLPQHNVTKSKKKDMKLLQKARWALCHSSASRICHKYMNLARGFTKFCQRGSNLTFSCLILVDEGNAGGPIVARHWMLAWFSGDLDQYC